MSSPQPFRWNADSSTLYQFTDRCRVDTLQRFRPNRVVLDGRNVLITAPTTDTYRVEPVDASLINFIAVRAPRALTSAATLAVTSGVTAFTNALNHIQETTSIAETHEGIIPSWIVHTSSLPGAHPSLGLATPWCTNGDILSYVRRTLSVDKLALMKQVASAIEHLHTNGFIHGNLHPGNILITDTLNACVTDVGIHALVRLLSREDNIPEAWQYKAPEELFPIGSLADGTFEFTKAMDTYSFACIAYAVYADCAPFRGPAPAGLLKIRKFGHTHLQQPAEMAGWLWAVLKRCWNHDPTERPTLTEIVAQLDRDY